MMAPAYSRGSITRAWKRSPRWLMSVESELSSSTRKTVSRGIERLPAATFVVAVLSIVAFWFEGGAEFAGAEFASVAGVESTGAFASLFELTAPRRLKPEGR